MTEPEPQQVRQILDRRFQVVMGKGGVGRSVVASALALRSSLKGDRTLLLEVNAPDCAARLLGVKPAPDQPREVLNNLWLCRMTPTGALQEYALMVLKFRTLYRMVFENRLVKYLLRSIPSLGEFTMLGKAWYHSMELRPDGRPRFDRVIIDAPATGHALTFLAGARAVAETVPAGPMKTEATKMADLIEDPSVSCFHLVALPEEMPVTEGLELLSAARDRVRMAPGLAIMNRMLPPGLEPSEVEAFERVERLEDSGIRGYIEACRRRLRWVSWQKDCLDRFRRDTGLPLVIIPEFPGEEIDPEALEGIAAIFDRMAGLDPALERAADG